MFSASEDSSLASVSIGKTQKQCELAFPVRILDSKYRGWADGQRLQVNKIQALRGNSCLRRTFYIGKRLEIVERRGNSTRII